MRPLRALRAMILCAFFYARRVVLWVSLAVCASFWGAVKIRCALCVSVGRSAFVTNSVFLSARDALLFGVMSICCAVRVSVVRCVCVCCALRFVRFRYV